MNRTEENPPPLTTREAVLRAYERKASAHELVRVLNLHDAFLLERVVTPIEDFATEVAES